MAIDFAAIKVASDWAHTSPLISCRFDPSGRYVFATAQDRLIVRWNLADGAKITFSGHDSWVRGLAFSSDGQVLVSGGYDQQLIWWDASVEQPVPIRKVTAHEGWVRWVAISPDRKLLATAGNDHLVKLWSFDDGTLLHTFTGHDRHVYSTHFHPNGKHLFSGDLRGVVKKWDVASRAELATFDAKALYAENAGQGAEYGGVRSMDVDTSGSQLICSGLYNASNPFGAEQEPLVVVLDVEGGSTLRSHKGKDGPKCIAWRTIVHPSGTLIGGIGGKGGGMLLFWSGDAETETHRFGLPNTVMDVDLHADGLQVATAHYDGHLRVTRLG